MPTAPCRRTEPRNRGMAKREKEPMGKVAEMRVIVGDKKAPDRAEGLRILEALLFAAEAPLDEKVLASRLPAGIDAHALLQQLQRDYAPRQSRAHRRQVDAAHRDRFGMAIDA